MTEEKAEKILEEIKEYSSNMIRNYRDKEIELQSINQNSKLIMDSIIESCNTCLMFLARYKGNDNIDRLNALKFIFSGDNEKDQVFYKKINEIENKFKN